MNSNNIKATKNEIYGIEYNQVLSDALSRALTTANFHGAIKIFFKNLINNEGLTTLHKAETAFYLLILK